MEAFTFDDAKAFRQKVDPFLLQNEARHNLILGVTGTLIDRPQVYPEFRLWAVEHLGEVVAAASRTPPWRIILADAASSEAVETLAKAVPETDPEVPGAVGNTPTVGRFVEAWAGLRGSPATRDMAQGVFALTDVRHLKRPVGSSRKAVDRDRETIVRWVSAFDAESMPHPDAGKVERAVGNRLEANSAQAGFWVWEVDGEPVSLSGYSGTTPNGIRIGPVYTPPGDRGRGYATAVVAEQSQWLLDHGRSFCFLYTDLANPTSNAIYRRIGYEQVAESAEYTFEV